MFPIVLTAALSVAGMAMRAGYGPGTVAAGLSVAVSVVLLVAEYMQPYAPYWLRPQGDVTTDVWHLLFSTMLVPALFDGLFRSLLLAGAVSIASLAGMLLWPHAWPLAGQWALSLVVAEFGQYWWHRAAHQVDGLWRFHATHHSPRRLYWLNSCRFHPIDSLAQYALEVTPLMILGAGGTVLGLFTLTTAVIGLFQHANIDVRLGPLNWIFSMTELHRWHHSRHRSEARSNYGANLIVWDVLFGTRFLPADRKLVATDVGLAGMPNFPRDYVGQLLSPFRWRRLTGGEEGAAGGAESQSGKTS